MAPLPPVAGVLKIELLWNNGGLPAANIMHVGYTGGPPSIGDLGTPCDEFATAFWTSDLQNLYSEETTFVGVRMTDLSSDTGVEGEYDLSSAGLNAAAATPPQCCVLLNYAISRRYRGGHPRTYFPGIAQSERTGINTWIDTSLPIVTAAWTAAFAAILGLTVGSMEIGAPVCVSYFDGGAPRVDPLVEPITGVIASSLIRTQRRRVTASSY